MDIQLISNDDSHDNEENQVDILETTTKGEYNDNELEDITGQVILTNGDNDDDGDDEEREDGSIIKLPKKYENSFSNYILLSHLITRMGDKSWAFIIPLFLITLDPSSLLPVSLFGLSTSIIRIFFGATIGKMTDQYKKIQIIKLGIFSQAIAIGTSCIVLFFLFKHVGVIEKPSTSTSSTSTESESLFSSGLSIFLFILLLILSALHSLATQMMDISVERKWTPSIVKRDSKLTKVNTRMRQIDLGTEMLAPFLAGLVAQFVGATAFLWIGLFNFCSFFPQYILLKIVYSRVSVLNLKIDKEGLIDFRDGKELSNIIFSNKDSNRSFKEFMMGEWNPLTNIIKGWYIFKQQSVFLVIISYCLLWFTCLSPHDPVLTAYLSSNGYTYIELSIFRAVGAIFGMASTFAFNKFVKLLGNNMNKSALIYILEEGILVLVSGFFFSSKNNLKYIFMASIVLSRCGLYGFELTEIHYVQRHVQHNNRGIVSGVESSLCSLATLTIFVLSSAIQSTNNFYILVWVSVSFVLSGGVTFFIWNLKYHNINNNNA